jgi:hypothetical protein
MTSTAMGGGLGWNVVWGAFQGAAYGAAGWAGATTNLVSQADEVQAVGVDDWKGSYASEDLLMFAGDIGQPVGPASARSTVRLVARSTGGENGKIGEEQHLGLIINNGEPRSPSEFVVQGGPVGGPVDSRLRAQALPVDDGMSDFSRAQGADWKNPSKIVVLKVTTIKTFTADGTLSQSQLDALAGRINTEYANTPYNYAFGPNSNTYVKAYMNALGLDTNLQMPVKVKGW